MEDLENCNLLTWIDYEKNKAFLKSGEIDDFQVSSQNGKILGEAGSEGLQLVETKLEVYSERCRLCLSRLGTKSQNIFSAKVKKQPVTELVMSLASVSMHKNDGLPELVCAHCISKIAELLKFRNLVQASQSRLNTMFRLVDKTTATHREIDDKMDADFSDGQKQDRFVCESCGSTYSSQRYYMTHIVTACNDVFSCQQCGEQFPHASKLRRHEKLIHNSLRDVILSCDTNFENCSSDVDFQKHVRSKHGSSREWNCLCSDCGECFVSNKLLKDHSKSCPEPSNRTKTMERTKFARNLYVCEFCGKSYKSNRVLYWHQRNLHDRSNRHFLCDLCGFSCHRPDVFRKHKCVVPRPPVCICNFCEKPFSEKARLIRHLRCHTKETPFECKYCHKRFSQKWNLSQHERIHTGKLPFGCDFCGLKFRYNCSLKQHKVKCFFNKS